MENSRAIKLLIGLGVVVLLLFARLFYIQIIDKRYKEEATRNAMVYDIIYPTRGIIYDRNGKIIVGNKVAYDIMATPYEINQAGGFDTLLLASVLNVSPDFLIDKMASYRSNARNIGRQSMVMLKQVSPEIYTGFAEVQYKFPGFRGQVRSIRDYPINAGGNLLGFVNEVNSDEIKRDPQAYRPGDYIGKSGLERAREKDLRGEKGYHIYLRNAFGQIKSPYMNGEQDKEAVPGHDIITTIDADLQAYGQELMRNKVGSLVAIEPSTGEILALVSSPGIEVEQLADIGHHYGEIQSNPYKPQMIRAVQAYYPPGSVFKLVNGLIGLDEKVLKESDIHPCNSGFPYAANRKLGCHAHSSPLALQDAIATSCNGYFCYVFRDILEKEKDIHESFDLWREYVQSFGFGRKLGTDFPGELSGNIPTSAYYNKIYGKRGWKFQTIISLSIGQGEICATPLQIANLCATVANRGWYRIPHIVKDSDSLRIDDKYRVKQYTMVDSSYFQIAVSGMYKAVHGGGSAGQTAASARIPGIEMCGKTGTAQNPHGKDNSVFMCFAPKDNPKIAVAAYIENAGFGATWACPIASLLVEKYLNGEISDERRQVEQRMMDGNLMPNVKTN